MGRWLCEFRAQHLPWVQELNAPLAAAAIRRTGLRRLTIDVAGSVVSTGQHVRWAQRGYNPHHRKVPSYYPITAYEAQSGQMLRVQNRPGAIPACAAPPDAWITTKIKLALLTTEGVSATAVSVDTIAGQVTLHGKVGSGEEKEKPESVAKTIDGVQGVRNLLQVVTPRHEKAVQRSDDDIKKQVNKALQANPSLKGSTIAVQSVNDGVVLLSGTAKTLTDHLSAVETAAGVPGVRRVASEIQSPGPSRSRSLTRRGYFAALVVNQICGAPFTPAFSIAAFNSADAAKALAFSALRKSCVTVTSFGLSIDR